mgnify:CR=1 FL=1
MSVLDWLSENTFVISLPHREDRRESVRKQLASIGHSSYEVFDAYGAYQGNGMTGWWGNKLSHYSVIDRAKRAGLKSVMVFEDDVVLHPGFTMIVRVAKEQLSDGWDWLQFGGNHRFFGGVDMPASPIDGKPYWYGSDGLEQTTPNLARIRKMLTAHAYIAKESVYDFILDHALRSPLSIDGFYAYEIHSRFKCYSVTPCVATQAPGMNDIGNVYSDYRPYIGD